MQFFILINIQRKFEIVQEQWRRYTRQIRKIPHDEKCWGKLILSFGNHHLFFYLKGHNSCFHFGPVIYAQKFETCM